MCISTARSKANFDNAQRSTGPRTLAGRQRSKMNALKHGMTGQGVVLPEGEAEKVARRLEALHLKLQPTCEQGRFLVGQMAVLMVRIERSAEQETAAIDYQRRHAAETFDFQREDAVDELEALLGLDPDRAVRNLQRTPEGTQRIIDLWAELRDRLIDHDLSIWGLEQANQADNLTGCKLEARTISPIRRLTLAVMGDFEGLGTLDDPSLDEASRRAWARDLLLEIVDQEVSELEDLLTTFDYDQIARDRANAGDRSSFDPSPEAVLARKYAAANKRFLSQAQKEFQELQAQNQAHQAPTVVPETPAVPGGWDLLTQRDLAAQSAATEPPRPPKPAKPPLGSFLPVAPQAQPRPAEAAPEAVAEPRLPANLDREGVPSVQVTADRAGDRRLLPPNPG